MEQNTEPSMGNHWEEGTLGLEGHHPSIECHTQDSYTERP